MNKGVGNLVNLRDETIYCTKGTNFSAAYDLTCTNEEDILLEKDKSILVGTGVKLIFSSEKYHALILPRSSTLKNKGIEVEIGLIDNDYKGELRIQMKAVRDGVILTKRDRIAQLLIQKTYKLGYEKVLVENINHEGFGSTGL